MRLGITIPHEPFQNPHLADLVRTAERCGYTDAWSYESFGADAFSPIAAASMVSTKLRFGTAIVPVFSRPAPLIAMSAITTNQISGGRFILGLGISTPNIMQGWMGVPFRKPVTMMKETVQALRAIFRGEKVTLNGQMVHINGFKIDIPFEQPPPIYIGAQGSLMLRLAGEIGDGLIVNFITPETLPAMLEHTREGMRATGKDPATLDVACRIIVALDEDEGTVRTLFKRSLTAYVTVPQYNKFFREIGFENEAGTAIEAWNAGDRKKALESVTDAMVEKIFVFGNAAQCKRRLDDYARGGITTTALQFSSFASTPDERARRILSAIEKLAAAY
ncbi:MAG TPA: LLM class F420-dependent oxidoreductase [Candidatus Binataceae bacterium]|nr:LLM class F420-dependent oxidoreductase [Candidatus Binataceae bacterium]